MPISLALSDARTEVIHLAAIDGKTGSNGRHSSTRINAILNRTYRELRSRVSSLGYPQFIERGTATALPGPLADEDYQEIAIPSALQELAGVDVLVNSKWTRLDPIEFDQRRNAPNLCPPSGAGFWAIINASKPSTTSITAGSIAVWPKGLQGSYKLSSVSAWTDITSDTHVFMLYDGWDNWLLLKAAMAICTRDSNKRSNYDDLRDQWLFADSLLQESAARLQRGGYTSPTPYGGIEL